MRRTLQVLLMMMVIPVVAASDVTSHEQVLDDDSRVLRQEVVVNAPLAEVWEAFTTGEGWESWAVPFAHVDLRVGGMIETSYDADARLGDAGNIRSRVLSFLPYRMLSIQAVQAPPGFEHEDLLPNLHSVIEFEPIDDERTRVAISGVGYGEGEGYDALLKFFRQGNAWTFEQLKKRFEQGPVDWRKTRAPE